MKKNKYEIDMCNGSIMDKLITFSLPLMLTSILQLMFNAVDIIVVGRFSGSQALAAVGSTTALINIFTNLFIGISLGANVLAARYFAAGRDREMSEAVHTAITLALISGIVMAFVGLGASRAALELMGTPEDVICGFISWGCLSLCFITTERQFSGQWGIPDGRCFFWGRRDSPMWRWICCW